MYLSGCEDVELCPLELTGVGHRASAPAGAWREVCAQAASHEVRKWVVVEKTVNKRGGTSWTWEYGAELREVKRPRSHPFNASNGVRSHLDACYKR